MQIMGTNAERVFFKARNVWIAVCSFVCHGGGPQGEGAARIHKVEGKEKNKIKPRTRPHKHDTQTALRGQRHSV